MLNHYPRLTDQARVAVAIASSLPTMAGPDHPRPPSVAHLVAALAGEPEGVAGIRLRQHAGDVAARIASHPFVGARSLPPLSTAAVALPVLSRPIWTLELLHAAGRVGGADLTHLLDECGVSLDDITDGIAAASRPEAPAWLPTPDGEDTVGPESFGLGSLRDQGYTAQADRAVAITRALGGDSHTLVMWIKPDDDTAAALLGARPLPLDDVLRIRADRGGPTDTDDLVVAITHLSIRAALD